MRLGRGQFTDDTELALSLANGLLRHDGNSQTFPADQVAGEFYEWVIARAWHLCLLEPGKLVHFKQHHHALRACFRDIAIAMANHL